jgi:POT family proton-dependent oligopeptide transporter
MGCAFALSSTIQGWIDAGERPNIGWQISAYVLLTAAEIMVSIVALEFSYTQAPRTMKSLILGLFLFSVSLGNLFTAGVNHYIQISSPGATVQEDLQATVDKDRKATATESHPGADEKLGTEDDLVFTLKFGEQTKVATPSKASLEEAAAKIEAWTKANDSKFPRPEVGTKELEGLHDQWGNAFHYYLENSRTCRITSMGPDQKSKTQWDVGLRIELKEEQAAKKASWTDALHPERPWLERRKEKINFVDETEKKGEKDSKFKRTSFAGGGERLEGASYYWFFTSLMFITAIIFMPYAFFYRGKTILQE